MWGGEGRPHDEIFSRLNFGQHAAHVHTTFSSLHRRTATLLVAAIHRPHAG